jgi:hypothetical protein
LLHQEFRRLAGGIGQVVRLHELPGIWSISGCTMTCSSSTRDEGVLRDGGSQNLHWILCPANWAVVAGLVEPFVESSPEGFHQWLCGPEADHGLGIGTISVLLSGSGDGRW